MTLDNDGIRQEKSFQLRRNRSAAKGSITKKIKEVTECFSNCDDIADVRLKAQEFHETATIFRDAHNAYHASLDDEFEIQDSHEYFECENQRIESSIFNEHSTSGSQRWKVNISERWIAKLAHKIQSATRGQDPVHDHHGLNRPALARARRKLGRRPSAPELSPPQKGHH